MRATSGLCGNLGALYTKDQSTMIYLLDFILFFIQELQVGYIMLPPLIFTNNNPVW